MRRSLATPKELSEFLAIPEATLRQWRYLGQGPRYTKLGQLVRYDWADVETWVEANRQRVA